jgi:hypothetical protein
MTGASYARFMNANDPRPHLEVIASDERLEVVDRDMDDWVVRIEPLPRRLESSRVPMGRMATAQGVAAGLFEALPELRTAAARFSGSFRVVFSARARKGLADGTFRLMGNAALPVAVDQAGRIVEIARVPSAAVGAGAGVAAGATLMAAWPVALAAGVATAAAWAEQRWLERTFADLGKRLGRVEARLRDDDLGVVDGADALVELLTTNSWASAASDQLKWELALARRDVDRIYFSRRRFVERFKEELERLQDEYEGETGERKAWAGGAVGLFGPEAADEIVVFLRSMVTRARLAACTADILVTDGCGETAIRLLDAHEEQIRGDYPDLHSRIRALARSKPDSAPIWRVFDREEADRARARAKQLDEALRVSVGEKLPPRDEALVIDVITSAL